MHYGGDNIEWKGEYMKCVESDPNLVKHIRDILTGGPTYQAETLNIKHISIDRHKFGHLFITGKYTKPIDTNPDETFGRHMGHAQKTIDNTKIEIYPNGFTIMFLRDDELKEKLGKIIYSLTGPKSIITRAKDDLSKIEREMGWRK